jgi:hypothetical protein
MLLSHLYRTSKNRIGVGVQAYAKKLFYKILLLGKTELTFSCNTDTLKITITSHWAGYL